MALQALVLHQVVEDRLILANRERPVGTVLQTQRHAGGAVVAEAQGVVASKETPLRKRRVAENCIEW